MAKIDDAVLFEALRRCAEESGHEALNQGRYNRWRYSLPDRRVVPNPLAFGDATGFQEFCRANGVECLPAKKTSPGRPVFHGSTRELRRVVERFLADSRVERLIELAQGSTICSQSFS